MKQYKKCGACKALTAGKCDLGYDVKTIFFKQTAPVDAIPLESCPKPLSTNALVYDSPRKY